MNACDDLMEGIGGAVLVCTKAEGHDGWHSDDTGCQWQRTIEHHTVNRGGKLTVEVDVKPRKRRFWVDMFDKWCLAFGVLFIAQAAVIDPPWWDWHAFAGAFALAIYVDRTRR